MVLVPPGNKVHIPDIPNWAWQEYGMRVGIWRIYEALSSRKIQATLSINGSVCTEYPRVAKAAKELDWEFLGHSFWQRPTHLIEDQPEDIQKTINEILYEKTKVAMSEFLKNKKNKINTFVIAGGVASNLSVRENLVKLANEKNFVAVFPPINLCSDNAAMIAWVGIERYKVHLIDNLESPLKARWPLDDSAPFLKGAGLKL